MIEYILEIWNPLTCKYREYYKGDNLERAEIMFNKPYNVRHTRRLIKITTEELYKAKAGKYLKKD